MRPRVLLCGTNFGEWYLAAIEGRYKLAGILSRGSLQSSLLAGAHGVPLYRNVADVPDVDFAIAAMGPGGNDAVLQLLRRGVDVLCEHPVDPSFVQSAMTASALFHVNAHVAELEGPRMFIRRCRRRRPSFIDARLSPRLHYAFFDILRRALGPLAPVTPDSIAGLPATVQLDAIMPDGDRSIDCRITAGDATLASISASKEERIAALRKSLAAIAKRTTPPEQSAEHLLDVSRAAKQFRVV